MKRCALRAALLATVAATTMSGMTTAFASGAGDPIFYFQSEGGFVKSAYADAVSSGEALMFFDNEDAPDQIVVTIDWGDGTPPSSSRPEDWGDDLFVVNPYHRFTRVGTFHETATVRGPHSGTNTTSWDQPISPVQWWLAYSSPPAQTIHVGDTFSGFEGHVGLAAVWASIPVPTMSSRISWGDGAVTYPGGISWAQSGWSDPPGSGEPTIVENALATGSHRYTRAGQYTVSADFTDSDGGHAFLSTNGSTALTVLKYTAGLTAGTQMPPVATSPTVLEAVVGGAGGGVPDPTGTVQFYLDGNAAGAPVPLSGDRADAAPIQLAAGQHLEKAVYSGDDNYGSQTAYTNLVVSTVPADVEIDSSAQPSDPGQPVTFSTFVTQDLGPAGGAPASGTVQFAVDGTDLGGPVTLADGKATAPAWTPSSGGDHQVSVSYSGDTQTSSSVATKVQTVRTPAPIVWPTPSVVTYGAAVGAQQLDATSPIAGTFAYDTPSGAVLDAGTHQLNVTFTPVDTWHYLPATASVTLTVLPAVLQVTAQSASRVYGAANPAFTATTTGFVNGDGPGVVSGAPVLTSSATATSQVGTYPISVDTSKMSSRNYTFASQVGLLTVTSAPLVAVAPDLFMEYGGPLPSATPSYLGFLNGDGPSSLTAAPTCTVHADATTRPGSYPGAVSCAGGSALNYSLIYRSGALTVTRAATTLSATRVHVVESVLGLRVTFAATLTTVTTGRAVPGEKLSFAALGKTQCTATTDSSGVASCTATVLATVPVLLGGGHRTSFAGDDLYEPSATTAPFLLF
jgi:hypothetical protein